MKSFSLALLGLAAAAAQATPSQWAGLIELGPRATFIQLRLHEGASPRAEFRLPDTMARDQAWQPLTLRADKRGRMEFELPAQMDGARCPALRRGDQISSPPKAPCQLSLVKVGEPGSAALPPGLYRLSDGRQVSVGWMADFPQPVVLELDSGRWSFLFSARSGQASTGPSMQKPLPTRLKIDATPAGGLRWQEVGKPALRAERVPIQERALRWSNGAQPLAGTLMLPPGKGPFAAVVLTQMSTDATREAYRQQAEYFLSQGLAALIYDRRGLGESKLEGGSLGGMGDLAQDAVAAVELLKHQPEVDPRRIGTWGHSQGGWVAPLAAARSADVAFVIAQSGPAVTAAEQEIYRVENSARAEGLKPEEVAAAVDYERRLMLWVKTGEGKEWLEQAARGPLRQSRWAHLVEFHETLPAQASARSQSFWYFDPLPDFAKIKVPMLAVYGDRDAFVPVAKSVQLLGQALKEAGNGRAQITVLPRAAHGLWEGEADGGNHAARTRGFHPDYFPTLDRWLREQNLSKH